MQGVMDFLREQELKAQDREVKLVQEKRLLEDRVRQLEEELQKQIAINKDMAKKLRMRDQVVMKGVVVG